MNFFSRTVERICQSLPAVMIQFTNQETGESKLIPEVLFYTRSRIHPIWVWIARMVILSAWKNYVKLHMLNENYTLAYARFFDRSNISDSIAAFKKIRQGRGWNRAVKGGQFAVEVSPQGAYIHAVLLSDKSFNSDLLNRYATFAWHSVKRIRKSAFPTLCTNVNPLNDFQIGFVNSLDVPILTNDRELKQIEALSPVYKFGMLNDVEGLNYDAMLNETIKAMRADN